MGNRLSRIVTRTGDDGTTSLGDGTRVQKDSARIEAIGTVDELNSLIGLLNSALPPDSSTDPSSPSVASAWLLDVQHDLFDLGAELSVPGLLRVQEARIVALEQLIESLNATLPPLKEFVLPGGGAAASACHVARTVCRRAERRGWALAGAVGTGTMAASSTPPAPPINPVSLRYLNRLSDLLFVLARVLARAAGGSEVLWRHRRGEHRD
jgi:cob(I)alamin adenosyltransferase